MLEIVKTTTFTGNSKIGDVIAKTFTATINTETPEEMGLNHWIVNYSVYGLNRDAVRAEEKIFEDQAYEFQQQLIAEKKAREEAEAAV